MEIIKVETEVTKEVYELGCALKAIMVNTKLAVADGFQAGQDIPAILMGSMQDLLAAVAGIEKVDDEFIGEPAKASKAIVVPVLEGVDVLVKKKES